MIGSQCGRQLCSLLFKLLSAWEICLGLVTDEESRGRYISVVPVQTKLHGVAEFNMSHCWQCVIQSQMQCSSDGSVGRSAPPDMCFVPQLALYLASLSCCVSDVSLSWRFWCESTWSNGNLIYFVFKGLYLIAVDYYIVNVFWRRWLVSENGTITEEHTCQDQEGVGRLSSQKGMENGLEHFCALGQ